MAPVYRFLAERIAERLGRTVELVVGGSFDQFERGQADLGVICGLPYVWLADRRPAPVQPLAAPVLAGDRYRGRPVYYSDVIVRRDSPITCLEELRGRSWVYNEPASHSGHTVTLYSLVGMGARPGFFGRVVEAGFHQRAIRLVHAGAVDAAAIDSQVLAVELRDHPELAGLRVIGAFGPSTIQPVVAASRLPDWLKGEVRELLGRAGRRPDGPAVARPWADRPLPPGRRRRLRRHPGHARRHRGRRLDEPYPGGDRPLIVGLLVGLPAPWAAARASSHQRRASAGRLASTSAIGSSPAMPASMATADLATNAGRR
jgi:phosphonate transport system substrate-binding protein